MFGTGLGSAEEREHTSLLPSASVPCQGRGKGRGGYSGYPALPKDRSVGWQLGVGWGAGGGEDEQSAKG